MVVDQSSRLGLLRRSPSFGLLFLATAGSSFGTYVAAAALTIDIQERTGSALWVAGLLIADLLPIVLIGLLFGPLVDKLSRRRLMIVSDLVRCGVFVALPFVDSPTGIVVLAGVAGIAAGFFRPAVYAGLPNLVRDDDLPNANALLQIVENLGWMIGPIVGAVTFTVWGPSVPYLLNAVTFLVSAGLVAGIPARRLRSEESLTRGHWRDVADGVRLVLAAPPLRAVLVVWNVVVLGTAAVNVSEIFFAKDTLGAGNIGFGIMVAASGLGLVVGSYFTAPVLGKTGLRRLYVYGLMVMALGSATAALSTSIWVAVPLVVVAAVGNAAAIICNQLLVQRGAPDLARGRAYATIFSSNYAVFGIGMAAGGVLTNAFGARWVWFGAAMVYAAAAVIAFALTRWLPVRAEDESEAFEAITEAAVISLESRVEHEPEPVAEPEPEPEPEAELEPPPPPMPALDVAATPEPQPDGAQSGGLERIAQLLERIERTRETEARRSRK